MDLEARTSVAQKVSGDFLKELLQSLQQAMAAGGPDRAVVVCQDLAPRIAGRLSRETGWRVTRVGTRVRNALLGTPDAWEQDALRQMADRLAKGERPEQVTVAAIVDEPQGRQFRFMRAIAMGPQCITCHGQPEQLAPSIRQLLQTHYPHDRATGYQPGDLRGAVSIKQSLSP
jgi:hypothetical protein